MQLASLNTATLLQGIGKAYFLAKGRSHAPTLLFASWPSPISTYPAQA
ncbi:hypothetical protein [Nitrospira sp. M1]